MLVGDIGVEESSWLCELTVWGCILVAATIIGWINPDRVGNYGGVAMIGRKMIQFREEEW